MTGRIVYEPTGEHCCVVMFRHGDNGYGMVSFDDPAHWAKPGTVLECDCGRTFVAQQPQGGEMFPRWRRESRFARWRRERRSLKDRLDGIDLVLTLPPSPSRPDPDVLPPSAAILPRAPKGAE